MRTQALSKSLSFKSLSLAVAVVSSVLASSVAHAGGFSAYVGATAGLSVTGQSCPPDQHCEHVAGGAKLFGGWNMTPNVAAELNYFYFGSTRSTPNDVASPTRGSVQNSARALAAGINWNIEMFEVLSSQVHLGVARVRSVSTTSTTIANKTVESQAAEYNTGPYIGLGLTFPINSHLRMVTSYDYLHVPGAGNRTRHLLSGGFQGEF